MAWPGRPSLSRPLPRLQQRQVQNLTSGLSANMSVRPEWMNGFRPATTRSVSTGTRSRPTPTSSSVRSSRTPRAAPSSSHRTPASPSQALTSARLRPTPHHDHDYGGAHDNDKFDFDQPGSTTTTTSEPGSTTTTSEPNGSTTTTTTEPGAVRPPRRPSLVAARPRRRPKPGTTTTTTEPVAPPRPRSRRAGSSRSRLRHRVRGRRRAHQHHDGQPARSQRTGWPGSPTASTTSRWRTVELTFISNATQQVFYPTHHRDDELTYTLGDESVTQR